MKDLKGLIQKEKDSLLQSINTICIVGAGLSGISLACLVKKLGKKIKVTDSSNNLSKETLKTLRDLDAELVLGRHSRDFLRDSDLIILSPGVDTDFFMKNYLSGMDTPCVGEIEFSYWLCKSRDIIAVTGTNGKTTTTYLIGKIMEKYLKERVYILGNIGNPFSSSVLDIKKEDIVVLEVSSFQLETIVAFLPHIACFLNFTEDHLDRYPDMDSYFKAKKRIFMNQASSDYAIFPSKLKERVSDMEACKIIVENEDNVSFIKKVLGLYNIEEDFVDVYLRDFRGLDHRLESVALKNGIIFIDDSKATNVSATTFALNKIRTPLFLIAGGRDKGLDYSLIKPFLGNVKKIFLIGEARGKIRQNLEGCAKMQECVSLQDAVGMSFKEANPGDTVLLSPMCSSFDMFKDYKERGNVFKEAVSKLPNVANSKILDSGK